MRAGEEFSAELSEYGGSYAGSRYGSSTWGRTPGRSRMPAEAEDALGSNDSPRGYSRGRSGLYYSPPGTSYTIVERPSSGMHHHSSREREFGSHHYSKSPRGTYLGSNPNFDRSASGNNKKRPISPEQVLRLFGSQNQTTTKTNTERPRRSPASSPASTIHQANYRPPSYGFSVHELVTRTVTMVREADDGTHGFGICVKGGKEAGVGVYISRVEEGSVAERAGLRPGDSILEVNGTPFTAITHEEALKEAIPLRLKAIHMINVNSIVEKILMIAKFFMTGETQSMLQTHSTMESFYKSVPQANFLKDYGGNDVTINEMHETMKRTLLKNSELFVKENQLDEIIEYEGNTLGKEC